SHTSRWSHDSWRLATGGSRCSTRARVATAETSSAQLLADPWEFDSTSPRGHSGQRRYPVLRHAKALMLENRLHTLTSSGRNMRQLIARLAMACAVAMGLLAAVAGGRPAFAYSYGNPGDCNQLHGSNYPSNPPSYFGYQLATWYDGVHNLAICDD